MWRVAVCGLVAALPCGCLANTYEIAPGELERLATTHPDERGDAVRAVQQTSVRRDRPAPPPPALSVTDGPPPELYTPPPGVEGDEEVEPSSPHADDAESRGSTTLAVDARGSAPHGRSVGHRRPRLGLSGLGGGGGGGLSGDGAVVVAAVSLAVAGGVMVAMVPTEGARHDGWLRLDSDQPVYLVRSDGASEWLSLDTLSPEDVVDAERAVVMDDGGVQKLDRAPLDREGFDYNLDLGAASLNTVRGAGRFGFQGRVSLGWFPIDEVGILGGGQFATADDDGRVFNGRLFAEVQALPLAWHRLHVGAFAEAGPAMGKQDGAGTTVTWGGAAVGGGGIAQVEITTRLALTLRGGYVGLPAYRQAGLVGVPEVSAGIALY